MGISAYASTQGNKHFIDIKTIKEELANERKQEFMSQNQVLFSLSVFIHNKVKVNLNKQSPIATWGWYANTVCEVLGEKGVNAVKYLEDKGYIKQSWLESKGVTNEYNHIVYDLLVNKAVKVQVSGSVKQENVNPKMLPLEKGFVIILNGHSEGVKSWLSVVKPIISRIKKWKVSTYTNGKAKDFSGTTTSKGVVTDFVGIAIKLKSSWAWNIVDINNKKIVKKK